jgi:guanine nucleotide-binding protein G(i) subunit alpha
MYRSLDRLTRRFSFFENVMRLAEDNYIPTEADVLRARTRTTGIEEAKFSFDDLTLK